MCVLGPYMYIYNFFFSWFCSLFFSTLSTDIGILSDYTAISKKFQITPYICPPKGYSHQALRMLLFISDVSSLTDISRYIIDSHSISLFPLPSPVPHFQISSASTMLYFPGSFVNSERCWTAWSLGFFKCYLKGIQLWCIF